MKELEDFLKIKLKLDINFEKILEKPKNIQNGDYSLACFIFSKDLKLSPIEIAKDFETKLNLEKPIFLKKISATGPFLNFYLNNEHELKVFLNDFLNDLYLEKCKTSNPEKILIEFPSPNTNKNLHIGHSRNMILANSLSNLLEKTGNIVIRTSMNNDRGIAICKTILSYQLFAENKTPKDFNMKPDEFVSHWYVLYGIKNSENPQLKLDEKAQALLVKWENSDEETIKLWRKLMKWVFEGYKITYANYNLKKFDKEYYESKIYKEGKEIILNAYKNKIKGFKKEDDGAIYYDFEDKTYGKKYLLRGDGTSLYMTQDLYLAKLKEKDFKADKSIFVVGEEQRYHFEVLFKLFDILSLSKIGNNYHLAYGYVYDENGQKFSSRTGNTIGADEILEKIEEKAIENIKNKNFSQIEESEIKKRAKIIAFSALSFSFLKVNPKSSINFSIEKALSFEGESGPYIQYTYARIKSIINKSNIKEENLKSLNLDYSINDERINLLIKEMKEYPLIIKEAAEKYKISLIPQYLLKLAQIFNEFYQNISILKEENENKKNSYLLISYVLSIIIKDALKILNIDVLEEM